MPIGDFNRHRQTKYSPQWVFTNEAYAEGKEDWRVDCPVGRISVFYMPDELLPDGWQFCDGKPIDDPCSDLFGSCTPNMIGIVYEVRGEICYDPDMAASTKARWIIKIRAQMHPLEQLAYQASTSSSSR